MEVTIRGSGITSHSYCFFLEKNGRIYQLKLTEKQILEIQKVLNEKVSIFD